MTQINLTILAGVDGGLIVYENVDGESVLVFGGDLEASTKYLTSRMSKIIVSGERKEIAGSVKNGKGRETPISTSLRRLDELEGAA